MMTEQEYYASLKQVAELLEFDSDPDPESVVGKELEILVNKIEEYDVAHYPMGDEIENLGESCS